MTKSITCEESFTRRAVRWLGSVQLAVPVMVLVAIGLGVGTYLESAQNVRIARQYVYGAPWFVAVMALMCVSLIFAVVARYPWKRRHIGFITVHAGLVALVVAGFWSMFGRVEGHLALSEGTQANIMETADEQLEVLAHAGGDFNSLDNTAAPTGPTTLTLAGTTIQVLERWENSRDEDIIADDSPVPLRAVDIAPIGGPQSAWVGQEDQAGPAPMLLGLKVLVLPEGQDWTPPAPRGNEPPQFVFVVGTTRFPLKNVGDEVFPGWKITEMKRYERALVAGESITEGPMGAPANVAVQVKIADGNGTIEQHTAFQAFPDMVMGKPLEGNGNSASRLIFGGTQGEPETIVIFGTVAKTKIGYIGLDGKTQVLEPEMKYPMALKLGSRDVTINQQLARAHQVSKTVKLPIATDNRPALLLRVGDSTELVTLAWKAMAHVATKDGGTQVLHFGPRRVQLPFTVRLADFRKTDYPGTEMAMAYESDVGIAIDGQPEQQYSIYMNNPYVHGPWKVYQSGFMGNNTSVFSIMRDPGLLLTYISSVVLCVGVMITFYSRSLSWGHPGIPIRPEDQPLQRKESVHASPVAVSPSPVSNPDLVDVVTRPVERVGV
ncbi:MAG: cytochrome c biogenesis protein ResB [Planctomycetota bacterium]|nr:cytochrome c biogenesis protein ResB [Planctomycetota bacterium]